MSVTPETIEAPSNGAEAPAAAGQTITTKTTIGTKPFGAGRKKDPIDELLASASEAPADTWSVFRISAKGYPRAQTGLLEVTLTGDDFKNGTMHDRLGSGVYRFTKLSDPKITHVVPLGTLTPPVDFGTAVEDDEDVIVSTPQGFVAMKAPKGRAAPYGGFPPASGGYGGGWAPPGGMSVAKEVVDGLKPFLEMQTKLLEKLFEQKNSGPDSKTMLEIERMKVEVAREDAKARAAEAKEERLAKEADLRERGTLEREIARENAKASIEAAKAQGEAAKAQAEAFARAQSESAKAQLETAREASKAAVEAAKERANSEKGMLDRYIAMQKELKADQSERPSMMDMIEEFKVVQGFLNPHATGTLGVVEKIADRGASILAQLITLKSMPVRIEQVAPQTATLMPVAPAALPAPAPIVEPTVEAEAQELKRQLMDGVKSLAASAPKAPDAAAVAAALKERLPKVYAWLRAAASDAILSDLDGMTKTSVFTETERTAVLGYRVTLEEHLAWLLAVVQAVKA